MRWQRPLRYGIGLAGLGFAAFLYTRFEHKPDVAPPKLPPALEVGVSYQSKMSPGFEQVRYGKDGKEISKVGYTNLVEFTDGRRVIENPRFMGNRDGKPFLVTADKGELRAKAPGGKSNDIPEETHLIGNVVMQEEGGMAIKTDDAVYNETNAMLDMPGAMTFSDTRASGSGVGALYDRNQQLLTLKDQAVIHMAADSAGQGRFDAQSKTMLINRGTHFVSLDGAAQVSRDKEVISADSAQMHLSDDNHSLQMMELHAHAAIVPVGGGAEAAPEMHADDITLEFQGDGRTIKRAQLLRQASMLLSGATGKKQITGDLLDVQLAKDGQTVTNITGTGGTKVALPLSADTPQREITSKSFAAHGDEKGLSDAQFQQDVVFLETRPATKDRAAMRRKVVSNQLTLSLKGGDFSDIEEATFRGGVEFIDGAKYGEGSDEMKYFAKTGKLALSKTGTTGRKQLVQTDKIRVFARTISIDLDKTGISASGELRTETIPDKAQAGKGLFDESKITKAFATSLQYDGDQHLAVYTGAVRLWQGEGNDETRIEAQSVSLDDVKGDVRAEGKVTTRFPITSMQTATAKGPTVATATKFEYRDSDHHATYTGTIAEPTLLNSADGKIYGVVNELWLTDDGNDLKRMLVTGSVVARVSVDRTVRVDRMDYDVKTGLYKLSGTTPSRVITRAVDPKGAESCSLVQGSYMTFTKTADGKGQGQFTVSDAVGAGSTSGIMKNCVDWAIK